MLVYFDAADTAALDADDLIRHVFEGGVVGDHHDEAVLFCGDVVEQFEDLLARGVIEGARGLVAEEELGVFGDGAGDGDALLFTPRELGGEAHEPFAQPDLFEYLPRVEGVFANFYGELDVFKCREVGHEVIELEDEADVVAAVLGETLPVEGGYVAAVEKYLAGGGAIHAAEEIEEGGLARARGAEHDDEFPLFEGEGDVFECVDADIAEGILFADIFE